MSGAFAGSGVGCRNCVVDLGVKVESEVALNCIEEGGYGDEEKPLRKYTFMLRQIAGESSEQTHIGWGYLRK